MVQSFLIGEIRSKGKKPRMAVYSMVCFSRFTSFAEVCPVSATGAGAANRLMEPAPVVFVAGYWGV
jgi:hypothetical protein